MKKYLRRPDFESGDLEKIESTEFVEIDENYDDSNDSDDTYYSADSVDEMLRWLNRERS